MLWKLVMEKICSSNVKSYKFLSNINSNCENFSKTFGKIWVFNIGNWGSILDPKRRRLTSLCCYLNTADQNEMYYNYSCGAWLWDFNISLYDN